ncbi:hypothetical protein CFE70_001183 [Pyrenophora teres f. teres 0-1]|uniref:Uncharacterized protein n=2 Tax=Pyrenophora teres f. teres TaxID=97479 RepID=E3S498_PYRTT|nr:hypothetical protein PTT_17352 [Pyrenophora teres f. teres 0-1]KAE8826171.1 hypothetical protein PTNB85_09116 [Pyrenophora teres f. teres]CAA9957611.1 hypothetical protein PTMSG1_01219 [Pyrenophora teres f. maculata]KAE8852769.1 hypothetical protein PTNB29_10159 [Pyrenophora teres f. teres]KAE8856516.1 hypothetical protein PTNB73_09781 [Pyrenophora teres f. teres]
MVLSKRYYCITYDNGERECFNDDSFWYSDTGIIVKWIILASFFFIFFGWFVIGHIHAKQRLKKGLPLLAYHRFLIPYNQRRGPLAPQNHFTFYQTQQPYGAPPPNAPYAQRTDGAWAEPPPLYQNTDAPPQYFAPPGASKTNPSQATASASAAPAMEMPLYGSSQPGPQQAGVVGSGSADVEQGRVPTQELPPRPAKAKLMGVLERFRK